MTGGLLRCDGVACCACGATSAPPAYNTAPIKNICKNCWTEFTRQFSHLDPRKAKDKSQIENDFNSWLARRVILDLKRLQRNGMLGRCEAVSNWLLGNKGYQCARPATTTRDGRPVCKRHGVIAHEVIFIHSEICDPYLVVKTNLVKLCAADSRIKEILRAAVQAADAGVQHIDPLPKRDWLSV